MKSDIRKLIFQLELFSPSGGVSYGIDAFYFNSDEIAEFSREELEDVLHTMIEEGLLTKEEGVYYRPTKAGLIACQVYLAKQGILASPLASQQSHDIQDLILAIVASWHVEYFTGSEEMKLKSMPIYLHLYSLTEIEASIESLTQFGLVKPSMFHPEECICITGRGLQKYRTETRLRLGLSSDEGICRQIEPLKTDLRFSRFGFDIALQQNLEMRWEETLSCAASGAYLAAGVMLGSVIEGALLAKLKENTSSAMQAKKAPKERPGSVKHLDDWKLADYIMVAVELNLIPKSVEKHSHELRDTRNLIHPQKQINDSLDVDESLYRISKEVAETVIDALSKETPRIEH